MIKSLKAIVWLFCSILVAMFGACGCSTPLPREYQVRVSPHMTPEQTQNVLDALTAWERAAVVHFDVTVSDDECGLTLIPGSRGGCIHVAYTTFENERQACTPSSVGCEMDAGLTRGVSSNVVLSDWLPSAWAVPVLPVHELGHAIGLQHAATGTVMCASMQCSADHITQADVDQYESLR